MSEKNLLENILQNPLVKQYRRGALTKKIYLLQSEGGSGKTTALLSLYLYLVQRSLSDMSVVPLFVDVKKLTEFGEEMTGSGQIGNMPRPIEKYIVKAYCGSDNDPKETMLEKVVHLFSPNNSPKFQKKYMYYLFLDGLNEVGFQAKQILWGEINSIAQADCVKIFVSSRTDDPNLPDGIAKLSLLPLKEEDIHAYLEHNFGRECTEKTDTRKINPSLVHILQIPMYLKVFRETYNHKSPYPDIYEENIVRKADILDSYIQKLFKDNQENEYITDKVFIEFVVQYFLPAFAFQMIQNNGSFVASDSDFRALRSNLQAFDSLAVPDEMIEAFQTNSFSTKTACLNTGLLVFSDNQYTFSHQDWRDFFAAKHLINCMNADKLDDFEKSVDANIRRFIGELVREYSKTRKYSKAYDNKVDERKSECDFEQKEDLQAWGVSPIEHFLQKHNLNSAQPLSAIGTRNLIDIMKTSRNNHITARYDYLNLSETVFYGDDYRLPNSTFHYSEVSRSSFFSEIFGDIVAMSISEDGKQIAVLCLEHNLSLFVRNFETNNKKRINVPSSYYSRIGIDRHCSILFINNNNIALNFIDPKSEKPSFWLQVNLNTSEIKAHSGLKISENGVEQSVANKVVITSSTGDYTLEIQNCCNLLLNGEKLEILNCNHMNCLCACKIDERQIRLFIGTDSGIFYFILNFYSKRSKLIGSYSSDYAIWGVLSTKKGDKVLFRDDYGITLLDFKTFTSTTLGVYDFNSNLYMDLDKKVAFMVLKKWTNEICVALVDIRTKQALQTLFFENWSTPMQDGWFAFSEGCSSFAVVDENCIFVWGINAAHRAQKFKTINIPHGISTFAIHIECVDNKEVLRLCSKTSNYSWVLKDSATHVFSKEVFLLELNLQKTLYLNYSNIVGCDFRNAQFIDHDDEDKVFLKTVLYENGGETNERPTPADKVNQSIPVPIKTLITAKAKENFCEFTDTQIFLLRGFLIACLNLRLCDEAGLYDIVENFCKKIKKFSIIDETKSFVNEDKTLYIQRTTGSLEEDFFFSIGEWLQKHRILSGEMDDCRRVAARIYFMYKYKHDVLRGKEKPILQLSKQESTFTIVNEDGEEVVYDMLLEFADEKKGLYYIVYTDNTVDDEGYTIASAATFDPTEENWQLFPIRTAEEWEKIEQILASLSDDEDSEKSLIRLKTEFNEEK